MSNKYQDARCQEVTKDKFQCCDRVRTAAILTNRGYTETEQRQRLPDTTGVIVGRDISYGLHFKVEYDDEDEDEAMGIIRSIMEHEDNFGWFSQKELTKIK